MYFRLVDRKNNHYLRVLEILGIVHYNVEMLQIMHERLYQVLKKTCPSPFGDCGYGLYLSGTKRRRVTLRFLKKSILWFMYYMYVLPV